MWITLKTGEQFNIKFIYDAEKIATECLITTDNEQYFSGMALCSDRDIYSKLVGRKWALKFALKDMSDKTGNSYEDRMYAKHLRTGIYEALSNRGFNLIKKKHTPICKHCKKPIDICSG